jgi:hypothetical protein
VPVHGSVADAGATWSAQRQLSERFELVVPNRRGFPPAAPCYGVGVMFWFRRNRFSGS